MKNKRFLMMDNKNVVFGYRYWLSYFLDMSLDLFSYHGLPDTLPSEEIEKRLIMTGYSIIFDHPVEGIVTCDGSLYDYSFYRRYRKFNVSNPFITFLQKNFLGIGKEIGKDGIVMYNTSIEKWMDLGMIPNNVMFNTIKRYARMMADIEATLSSELITQRMPFLPVASNQQTADSVKDLFKKLESGDMSVILDSDFLQDLKVLKNKELVANYITELIENRKNLLGMFYSEIGIYQPDAKRERLIASEVENGKNNEKALIYSMLKEREKGIHQFNAFFGYEVTVEINRALYDDNVSITQMESEEVGNED